MPNLYCTADDLNRYLSSAGIDSYIDHDNDGLGDEAIVDDCIEQASVEIDAYAFRKYAEANLAGDRLLKRWAVVMACRFLCLRRGNSPPESLEIEFQRITDPDRGFLPLLAAGKYKLPGVPLKPGNTPTFSNLTVDRRYRREKVRVTMANSNNESTLLERDAAREIVLDG